MAKRHEHATGRAHQIAFASELLTCGHCGRPITGERKTKRTASGERDYVHYRCARCNAAGHPRDRVTETELNRQFLEDFGKLRIENAEHRQRFADVLKAKLDRQTADRNAERGTH